MTSSAAASARATIRPLANGICVRCFGPLEPVYDWDELAAVVTRERIEAGPHSLWRYADLLPAEPPPDAANGPGMTPLVPAPRLASALGIGEVLPEARPREPDALVQGPRRRGRRREGDRVRPRDALGHLDRQPRERRRARALPRSGCRAVIFCPAGLEAEKFQATTIYGATIYGVRGSYDDCSRLVSELAGEVDWGIVNVNLRSYYAEGSKTLAFEIGEQLGWETPTAVVMPIGSGAMFTKIWQGFEQFDRLGLIAGERPRLYGGQAEGCSPVASAFADERRVSPVRPALDRLVDRDRQPGRRRPRDRDRADVGRRDLRRARGRGRRQHRACSPRRPGSSARARPASRSARCARWRRAARSASRTASS